MYNNTKNQSAFDNLRDDMDRYVGTKQLTLAKQTLQNYYPEYQDKVEVINQMWEDFEKNKVGGLGYTKEQFAKAYPELSGFGISEEKQKTLNAFKEHQSLYESIVDLDESKYDSLSDTGKALYDLANIVEYVGDEYRKVYAVDQTVNNAELFEKFAQKNGLPADVRAIVDKVKNSKDELSKEDETLLFNGKTYMEDNPLLYPFTQIKKGVEWLINDIQSMEDKRKQYERGEIMDRR
ncbi:MAG: hypothetical protein LBG59_07465 [Candidatus Peribacteria bacterium]|jgi:hypothetical protein|nr:hypothetical protein [Candidatus Peribacteria bacterium]